MRKVLTGTALLCLSMAAGAQVVEITVTETPATSFQLFDASGTRIGTFPTMEACKEAAPTGPAPGVNSSCRPVIKITKTSVCAKTAPPFPVEVDAEGFLKKPGLRIKVRADGTWEPTEIEAMVSAPYPDCWVKGWVRYVGQDIPVDPERVAYAENPADFAPEPLKCDAAGADLGNCIDPEACIDTRENMDKGIFCPGPGPGPEGAETVDKPG